jgi:MFS transporter, PPP family, 3-phenylpropionic acid transporter
VRAPTREGINHELAVGRFPEICRWYEGLASLPAWRDALAARDIGKKEFKIKHTPSLDGGGSSVTGAGLPYWRLSGFYFCYFAFVGAFSPYWSLYLRSIAFDAFQIGVLMSLLQVMRMFAPAAWGWLADHTGRRTLIIQLGGVLSLVAISGVFFATSFAWMFAVMAATSFFWGASLPLVEATTLSHLGKSTSGYGRIRSWGSIGFIVAVIGVGYLLDVMPIRVLPWVVTGLMLGIALFSRWIPDAAVAAHHTDALPVWEILRRPEVIALFSACFLMAAAHGPYYTFYSIYLVDHGYSKASVGWLWATGVICEIGMFMGMARLMARFSLTRILGLSFACAVLRFLITGWAVDQPPLMFAAQVLHAATFGSYHAAAVAAVHHFFRGRHQAKGQALYTALSFGAGGTLGGLLSGVAWEAIGPSLTFTAAAGAAMAGGMLIVFKVRSL